MSHARAFVLTIALLAISTVSLPAKADGGLSAAVAAAVVQVAHQMEDMGDGSDWKVIFLSGSHCGRSKNDGENRSTRLARYYRELTAAIQDANAELIVQRAVRLRDQVNASKMYQSCFRAMGRSSKVMKVVNEIIAAAAA